VKCIFSGNKTNCVRPRKQPWSSDAQPAWSNPTPPRRARDEETSVFSELRKGKREIPRYASRQPASAVPSPPDSDLP